MNNLLYQSTFEDIPLTYIESNSPIRKEYSEKEIDELFYSIAEIGLIHPIMVKRVGEKYEVISGERRYRAFLLLNKSFSNGYDKIPCQVVEKEHHPKILSLCENIQRVSLTPFEEAEAIYSLIGSTGMGYKELGYLIGKSEDYVEKRMRYLRLLKELKSRIDAFFPDEIFLKRLNRVEMSKILLLKPLIINYKPEEAYELLVRIVKEGLSQCEIKESIQSYNDEKVERRMNHNKEDEEVLEIFSELGLDDIPIGKKNNSFRASQLKLNEKRERNQMRKRLKPLYTQDFWEKLITLIRENLHLTIYQVNDFQKSFQRLILRMGATFLSK